MKTRMESYAVFRTTKDDGLSFKDTVKAENEKQAIKRYMASEGTQVKAEKATEDSLKLEKVEGVPFTADLNWSAEGEEAVNFHNDFVVVKTSELTGYIAC